METDLLQQNGSGATIFQLKKRKIKKYEKYAYTLSQTGQFLILSF